MKHLKTYERPKIEIVELNTEDVIVTSGEAETVFHLGKETEVHKIKGPQQNATDWTSPVPASEGTKDEDLWVDVPDDSTN